MNFNEIRNILNSDNNEINNKLLLWCNEHLKKYLVSQNFDLYQPPYIAEVSDKTEKYKYTWESGQSAMLTRNFANVYDISDGNKKLIGEYELGNYKGVYTNGTFCPIYRNGKWYALVSPSTELKVYTLPELKEIACNNSQHSRIVDIYCPRMYTSLNVYTMEKTEHSYYHTLIDNEIEEEGITEWESAPFAFVHSYDPLCSGTNYVQLIDLRNIDNGEIIINPNFFINAPEKLTLRQIINLDGWDKECPRFTAASEEHISAIDGTSCGPHGWTSEQLDWFSWMNEIPDPRCSNERWKTEFQEWKSGEVCQKIQSLFNIEWDDSYDYNNIVYSKEQAETLAKNNPLELKQMILRQWWKGALCTVAYLIYGLGTLLPDDNIKEIMFMILNENNEYAHVEAIKALKIAYPKDKQVNKIYNKLRLFGHKYSVKPELKKFHKEMIKNGK